MTTKLENVAYIACSKCFLEKQEEQFYKRGKICCDCNNEKRRQKYKKEVFNAATCGFNIRSLCKSIG